MEYRRSTARRVYRPNNTVVTGIRQFALVAPAVLREPRPTKLELHLVSNHEYRTMWKLFAELQARGYRRLGLVNRRDHDERVDHNWLAAYLVEQNQLHRKNRLPPLILDRWDAQAFLTWFMAHRPDAIVTRLPEVLACLRAAGLRIPADVGVAFHSLDEGRKGLSGMKKNSFQIGVMAVDFLVDMLHRNERGVPAIPYRLMVEGNWCEGKTVFGDRRTRQKLVRRSTV